LSRKRHSKEIRRRRGGRGKEGRLRGKKESSTSLYKGGSEMKKAEHVEHQKKTEDRQHYELTQALGDWKSID